MHWKKRYKRAVNKGIQLISDKTIRKVLKDTYKQYPYLEEVRFPSFTADMLVINPAKEIVAGFEIKSDRDNIDKLEHQLKGYLTYCHKVYVVTTLGQIKDIMSVVNRSEFDRVGVYIYRHDNSGTYFQVYRQGKSNKVVNVGTSWISKAHQLYQWLYLLEMIWG